MRWDLFLGAQLLEIHFARQYLTNFGLGFFGGYFLLRQRIKRRASRDRSRSVRLTIRQTLASRAFDGKVCPLTIGHTERGTV